MRSALWVPCWWCRRRRVRAGPRLGGRAGKGRVVFEEKRPQGGKVCWEQWGTGKASQESHFKGRKQAAISYQWRGHRYGKGICQYFNVGLLIAFKPHLSLFSLCPQEVMEKPGCTVLLWGQEIQTEQATPLTTPNLHVSHLFWTFLVLPEFSVSIWFSFCLQFLFYVLMILLPALDMIIWLELVFPLRFHPEFDFCYHTWGL